MSYFFEVAGNTVWNPSLRSAQWYLPAAQNAADLMRVPSGLTPGQDDTCAVDVPIFQRFTEGLLKEWGSTRHPVAHALMRGVLLPSVVMLERAGVTLTPGSDREAAILAEADAFSRAMAWD
ncbi:hypothetical protein SAMN05192558_101664 [Actinokineospora alba]|uniref:Uncharacterized protein n=1 Tax=Actinokineospora alba TaxID=504798 RepID=A0A1H0G5F3_9PSEU|nr:DUF6086 family protein [Actinokineospora alba]TDP69765.1 hypothetical protein C8E96_5359 [Actinokineospora alba]SDI09232.1 hypothetical protein SAMN05421871_103207 [Actinokineospora alba]SDO01969.1 hypothetical protein SAMN05192558_101664 [Actinokineospora alba]